MDVTPLIQKGKKVINKYGKGSFTVDDVRYSSNIVILPDKVLSWNIVSFNELSVDVFKEIFRQELTPEILLIGTGENHQNLGYHLEAEFAKLNVIPEVMSTGAAARTYNTLLAESRNIAAALILV